MKYKFNRSTPDLPEGSKVTDIVIDRPIKQFREECLPLTIECSIGEKDHKEVFNSISIPITKITDFTIKSNNVFFNIVINGIYHVMEFLEVREENTSNFTSDDNHNITEFLKVAEKNTIKQSLKPEQKVILSLAKGSIDAAFMILPEEEVISLKHEIFKKFEEYKQQKQKDIDFNLEKQNERKNLFK